MTELYPKRLIEVDLPIKQISVHARREKSIRHGHISTLHIWWARRPLAACRAVILAALWPDPADPLCPPRFLEEARESLNATLGGQTAVNVPKRDYAERMNVRAGLLDFIAEFANWDHSTNRDYLNFARHLVHVAHESLGGPQGSRPLVVDPFAGGGSIPLEALRVEANVFASDLNPVAVLLNKVAIEYIPKYGGRLAEEVRMWGAWVKEKAERELAQFYPKDSDGASPIAYLWARTVRCEGPGCGADVPLLRSLWLAKKGNRSVALRLVPQPEHKRVDFEIIQEAQSTDVGDATVKRGSATCPVCGFTMRINSVRRQLKDRRGGTNDARMTCVVTTRGRGAEYRSPTERDFAIIEMAKQNLAQLEKGHEGSLSLIPDEPTPAGGGSGAGRAFSQRSYGMDTFGDLFTPRQQLVLARIASLVNEAGRQAARQHGDRQLGAATAAMLSMALGKLADFSSSLCTWRITRTCVRGTFTRQALPITWDFGEMNPFGGSAGDWDEACRYLGLFIEAICQSAAHTGHVQMASATEHPLPDASADAFVTDPPYYDAVPYADLSDYFYVWHRRALSGFGLEQLNGLLTPKAEEVIVDPASRSSAGRPKDAAFYESAMREAMRNGLRILRPNGIGVVVFAHKSTAGWEAMLRGVVDAGWVVTGSWPIDTERPGRLRAQESAALASSVHLVCRPRSGEDVGEWREVLSELPRRIHQWLPRLAEEGVVGADAIFACLGPALEVFSRHARVEKASGEAVTLREYLEQVWAAVAREAMALVFRDADASELEPDARLTAMWLWTLSTNRTIPQDGRGVTSESIERDVSSTVTPLPPPGMNRVAVNQGGGFDISQVEDDVDAVDVEDQDEMSNGRGSRVAGFILEFDAARKIAQGLGAHIENLGTVVEIKGKAARLLPVVERAGHLLGKVAERIPSAPRRARRTGTGLLPGMEDARDASPAEVGSWKELGPLTPGVTVLDRVHQAMLLFGTGRSEALKRFVVEEGAGTDTRFWKLAQSLSALYPTGTDEKRWVDGVLARKKGLGF